MLPLKPPYNILHFINILLSPKICTFWDIEIFLQSHPIFSALSNLNFLTSETQKFKFDKFLPHTLSPTQNEPEEPKRSWINPHLDYETAVYILLEDTACRCFDLAHTDLAHLSPNRATHLKSPKNCSETVFLHVSRATVCVDAFWSQNVFLHTHLGDVFVWWTLMTNWFGLDQPSLAHKSRRDQASDGPVTLQTGDVAVIPKRWTIFQGSLSCHITVVLSMGYHTTWVHLPHLHSQVALRLGRSN